MSETDPAVEEVVEEPIIVLEEEVVFEGDARHGTGLQDAYGVGGFAAAANGVSGSAGGYWAPPERAFAPAEADGLRSTFSIDVDTASYSNVRRFLQRRTLPDPGDVRIEELINYFSYAYPGPAGDDAFAVHTEVASCPWAPEHRLVRVALQGRKLQQAERPPCNLVFLIDVSGSMQSANKLPLLKESLRLLVHQLGERDRIAIVTYAGASGLALPSTSCGEPQAILDALEALKPRGSTNGAAGIQLAYRTAIQHAVPDGVNRVILATDGDWNVGIRDKAELEERIAAKAKSGVFLSVLGFGGGASDRRMEALADRGNGNYAAIDVLREARKALVQDLNSTLVTIAQDVKIQVEFDPSQVASYRLIGYENRALANADFANDAKDAGEIGAGHSVTALYEIVPAPGASAGRRTLTVRVRHKEPEGEVSALVECDVLDAGADFATASVEFRFASAVAAYGLLLSNSKHAGAATYDAILDWAGPCLGDDPFGYRAEFTELVRRAHELSEPETEAGVPLDRRG